MCVHIYVCASSRDLKGSCLQWLYISFNDFMNKLSLELPLDPRGTDGLSQLLKNVCVMTQSFT